MKLTESKLRGIIREELSRLTEMGGGDEYAFYEIRAGELPRVKNGEKLSKFGIKVKEGSLPVLQNWGQRQNWMFRSDPEVPYLDGYFVEHGRVEEKYYVVGKNK